MKGSPAAGSSGLAHRLVAMSADEVNAESASSGGSSGTVNRVSVVIAPESLDVNALRAELDLTGCGSVVTFLGVTRGEEDGVAVERLEFDAWEEQLPIVLGDLGEQAIAAFGVHSVAISHRTGSVEPGEPIVAIHVASPHRAEGFEACSWLIDELKAQAPLWKREVRADGAIWKAGLG